jgi:Carboxypeptidase regulatory-like domain/TonB dependent receptor
MRVKHLLTLLLTVLCAANLLAQVTTASMSGFVTDEKNEGLIGATVVAVHQPSGTRYGVTTLADGRYNIPNMRVGGPYKVTVSYVGFQNEQFDGISLQLAQKLVLNAKLKGGSATLDEVVVKVDAVMNGTRTGAATNIDNAQLRQLPTISRSANDYTRLNPMAAEGGSFGGRNNQYNNYSLDGAIFNNPFGLDAAQPGGQADAQAVSLDAIDQIQVSLAPYDVTQAGFTGAGVNAVTKSGTNKFTGTAFAFFRNKDMIGTKVKDATVFRGDLSALQAGFAVGGPIIKDKLFFFANFELERRSDLGSNFLANRGTSGPNVSRVLATDLDNISNLLRQTYQYETGAYENYKHNANNQKALFKLDWNINQNHKLSATVNFLDAFKDKPANPTAIGRRGPDAITLQYFNSGYRINNKILSSIIDLKSQFGSKFSNKLQVGFSEFNDSRDPFSAPFPVLNFSKDGVRYIVAGHEPFSINNKLDQRVFQLTDNFNIYAGKHTYTIGTSLERFSFDNSFNLTGYGARVFFGPGEDIASAATFIRSAGFAKEVADARAAFTNNNAKGTWALAQTTLGQFALYAQDEWAVNPKFTLTYGLRMDMPLYFNTKERVEENIARNGGLLTAGGVYAPDIQYYNGEGQPTKLSSTTLPAQKPLFSPRVGFNYDLKGDRSQQLRGGSGLFTGRFPFVWIGNQVANPAFFFYCVTDPNFKFPQVWRTNLGYDHKFKNGWLVSADVIYTKDVNAVMVQNWGLKTPTGRLQGVDTRPVYLAADRAQIFGGATNAYVFTNNNLGSTFNLQVQAEKTWTNGLFIRGGYNFLDARDGASTTVEISSDVYDLNPADVQNSNRPILGPAPFGNRHRFVGVLAKEFKYSGNWSTNVAIFSEYVQGNRYSFTYSGDINNDGGGNNDLIFIPTAAQIGQMKFSGSTAEQATQRAGLEAYISQDKYLSSRRGQYAEKFASLNPWYSKWDVRLLQTYALPNKNTIQLSVDILNAGNLISSNWGVRQLASTTRLAQPLGVSVDDKGAPTYSFDASQRQTYFNDFSLLSRWQVQVGLRYSF